MPFANPDPLRPEYFGQSIDTTGGARLPQGASIDQANDWLHAQPWYQAQLRAWGNPKTLTLGQRGLLGKAAIANGLEPGFFGGGIDTSGNVSDGILDRIAFISGLSGSAALAAPAILAGSGAAASGGGASTAAAGGAPVAATASGAGWFSPANIIPASIQGIASIFGANSAANASSEAAQLQYKSTEEALADARKQREYEQAQYANYIGRLQPYLGLGTTASSTLQNLLARSPYTKLANNGPLPMYSTAPLIAPAGPRGSGSTADVSQGIVALQPKMGSNTGTMNTGGVTLQAPDGSVKVITDPMQVQHYQSLGARVIA